MSSHIVEVVTIDGIKRHPNADRLDIAEIKGWQCIVGRGKYAAGDKVIYIPIDSVLSPETEKTLFPPDSKIVLHKGRVRTIKLRGEISQGLVAPLKLFSLDTMGVGSDVASIIGVTKYEPPTSGASMPGVPRQRPYNNPLFHKYTDIEHLKHYPNAFQDGEHIYVAEKIHGANFRAGWVKTHCNTLWKKIKRFFGRLPEYEFVYGSRNIQLQDKIFVRTFYEGNPYLKMVEQYDLKNKLKHGEVVYGELYGFGIQANYSYGCGKDEHKLIVFDVKKEDENGKMRYLDIHDLVVFCLDRSLTLVPLLYSGPFSLDQIKKLAKGASILAPSQPVREGVVIRPTHEEELDGLGRKIVKFINDDFLLDHSNTDNK